MPVQATCTQLPDALEPAWRTTCPTSSGFIVAKGGPMKRPPTLAYYCASRESFYFLGLGTSEGPSIPYLNGSEVSSSSNPSWRPLYPGEAYQLTIKGT